MVLPALYQSYSVVRLALHLWRGSRIHLHHGFRMELRLRLRLWLLSLVLPVVGTDGILRIRLVSLLRMGSVGRSGRRQRLWRVGQHGVLAHRSRLGQSLHRQLRRGYAAARTTTRQTGRTTVAGRGTNTNIYTGNTAGYRGGATYNPNTGIVAGGGAGYAGNIYSGQGTAGRGGFAYNTNTNAGVAAGKNNVYAGKDGTVYRYNRNSGNWSSNSGSGWQSATKPDANLQRQQQMRTQGAQRSQNFNSTRSYSGARMGGGGRRR